MDPSLIRISLENHYPGEEGQGHRCHRPVYIRMAVSPTLRQQDQEPGDIVLIVPYSDLAQEVVTLRTIALRMLAWGEIFVVVFVGYWN
jgi:hypothetical protein